MRKNPRHMFILAILLIALVSSFSQAESNNTSDEWICSNCGSVAIGKFCSECGSPRELSASKSVDGQRMQLNGFSMIVPEGTIVSKDDNGTYLFTYYSEGDQTSNIRLYFGEEYLSEEEKKTFSDDMLTQLNSNLSEMYITLVGATVPIFKIGESIAGCKDTIYWETELTLRVLTTEYKGYILIVILQRPDGTYCFDIESDNHDKIQKMYNLLSTIEWDREFDENELNEMGRIKKTLQWEGPVSNYEIGKGMYIVGEDIPAGTYELICNKTAKEELEEYLDALGGLADNMEEYEDFFKSYINLLGYQTDDITGQIVIKKENGALVSKTDIKKNDKVTLVLNEGYTLSIVNADCAISTVVEK